LLGIGASLTLRLQRLLATIAQNLARIALLSIGLGRLDGLSRGLVSHVCPYQSGPHRGSNHPHRIARNGKNKESTRPRQRRVSVEETENLVREIAFNL